MIISKSCICNSQCNFRFLLQFLFFQYTFSCVISLIFEQFFFLKHQLIKILENQSFRKILFKFLSWLLFFVVSKFHISYCYFIDLLIFEQFFFVKHQLIKILGNQSFGKILLIEFISQPPIFVVTKFHIANKCL